MKSIRPVRSSSRRQQGQSLVELAISLTVMLLLLAGAVTFGMALFSYVAIRDAAQEGALFGSFNPPYTDSNANNKVDNTTEATTLDLTKVGNICQRVQNASTSPVNMSTYPCTHDDPSDGSKWPHA